MRDEHERVLRFVRQRFLRCQRFPTVRQVARALRLRQGEVEVAAEQLPLMLTSYNTRPPQPLGEHFVEICE